MEASLQAHRLELLCYSREVSEAPAAEVTPHKALFDPPIPAWLRAVAMIQSLHLPTDEAEIIAARDTAVRELRTAASYAGNGNS